MPSIKIYRNIRSVWLLTALLLSTATVKTALGYHFDFNDRCIAAYQALLALKIGTGNALIEKELQENPDNLVTVLLSNYSDCLPLLFNGDPTEYKGFKNRVSRRLEQIEQGDPSSPWYLFCKATINFQNAAVRLRFNEYLNGGTAFRKSYLQYRENAKKFPDFPYNQLFLGLDEALIGTIPNSYKWLSSLLGLKGDVKKGTGKIKALLSNSSAPLFREEILFYYSYLSFFLLSKKSDTWRFVQQQRLDEKNNLVFTFMKANMALNYNKASTAENILKGRNQSETYLKVPMLDYLTGLALLHKIDPRSPVFIKRFIRDSRGKMYLKDAYQKLSIYYHITGNSKQAQIYKQKIRNVGATQIDADKQAQRYSERSYLPHSVLLKARYQCEGGYFTMALKTLDPLRPSGFSNTADLVEYYYRYGRAYALKGNFKGAVPFYEKAIEIGATRPEQFAARSAVELGELYEDRNNRSKALHFYRKCLQMPNEDYKSSLDQRAKAGINRLGGES